ncbi:hypothetical protein [Pleionea sp. CnH1-48]|uniref:hypothetical protein n=1 Tax=Pleionea sp. CnH1-48 TaxID=2954494 RepID=UPI0020977E24|nr:hypothetical protein [Pleionea sp. CnH1-48]MCO7223262.1 hypothetical protein [Pleionea sp. CnH1-48]
MLKLSYLYSLLFAVFSVFPFKVNAKVSPEIDIGGAVRLNYSWKDYDSESNGTFDFELFRIDMDVKQEQWFLDAQFRWYQGFEAIHHAEVGYKVDSSNTLVAGITQVPFGIAPYASHSFWFGGTYYLGLEDDYDAGIKWRHSRGKWNFDSAYFFNSEYDNPSRWGRYSFDIASSYNDERNNKEDGGLSFRAQYKLAKHTVGASFKTGKFRNLDSMSRGDHWAAGIHFDGHFNSDWNLQAQYILYEYDAESRLGTGDHRIALAAFEFPFEIATKAEVSTFNIAKTFTIKNDFVDTVTCYNDSTYISASDESGLTDSVQNVTGCLLAKGGLYTYVDWIAGKNMWFAGGPGIGIYEGHEKWRSRLNINIGYYF